MPHAFLAGLGRVFFLIELSGVLRLAIVGLVLWRLGRRAMSTPTLAEVAA